jgi:hypothetical protein
MADDSAAGRPATCKIDSLDKPIIELLPGNAVPRLAGSVSEVVILFKGLEKKTCHPCHPQNRGKLGYIADSIDLKQDSGAHRDEEGAGGWATRGHGDTGTRGHGDTETRRHGGTGIRGCGDAETGDAESGN